MVLLTLAILLILTGSLNRSVRNTAQNSMHKAAEILGMRLNDCELASKNASYLPVISESYRTYLADGDRKDLNESVTTFLKQQYRFHTMLKDAVLIFTEYPDELYYTYNNSRGGTYKDIQSFQKATLPAVPAMSEELDTDTRLIGDRGRIYMIRNLVDSKFKPYAMLILEIDPPALAESLQSVWGYSDGGLFLQNGLMSEGGADENGWSTLLPAGEELMEAVGSGKIDFDASGNEQTGYVTIAGKSFVTARLNQYGGIGAVVMLDNHVIKAERRTYLYFALILLIFLVPLLVMVRQYEQIYREEISLRDARIMALQSQINPHFLNNTLEIINWEARLSENYKISGMIEALSTMLSATMNRKAQSMHSLREEMNYVDAYLYIIERRFGEQLQVSKEIDEGLLETKVPRLIIQPIVENAVEHGVDASKKNTVVIRIRKEGDFMMIGIENTGLLEREDEERIHEILYGQGDADMRHTSLGIRNVNSRLKLIYGEACGLTIENDEEKGCTVSTIKITISDKNSQG